MTKLLNAHRTEIANRLLAATFADREERLKKAEHALGLRVLRATYGDDALRRMADLPDGWLPTVSYLYVKVAEEGHHTSIHLTGRIRVPAEVAYNNNPPVLTARDRNAFEEIEAHRTELKHERATLYRQTQSVLLGFTTVERLAAEWPEGYAHFPHAPGPTENLPALRIEDLNARLAAAREAA